jgi:M6 family metalloprotease-like protein
MGYVTLAALILCLAGAARAQAQSGVADIVRRGWIHGHARPRAGFYEFAASHPGAFEFKTGWLEQARVVRQNRAALRARGAYDLMNAQSRVSAASPQTATAVSGTLRYPTFMPFFSNTSASDSALMDSATVLGKFWGTSPAPPYSITTYYQEISIGRLTVTGNVIRRGIRLAQPDTFYAGPPEYGQPCQGTCDFSRVPNLITEMLTRADSLGVDFSPYADPSTGKVPGIVILDPQVGGECYQVYAPAAKSIWAHRYSLSGWTGSPYTTRSTINGHPVVIDDYIIQGGQGGSGGCTPGQLAPIGTVTHETGHLFGLPDLYDTDPNFLTEGLGHWDLMSSGNEQLPYRPSHMSAWSLSFMGWISEVPITTSQTITTGPIEVSDTAFIVPMVATPDHEFFLIENRQPIGSDSMMAGPGLMIYHTDTVLINDRSLNNGNSVNAVQPHGIWILEAKGDTGLDCTYPAACNDRGDAGDPYPGSSNNPSLGFTSRPASLTNAGAFAGVIIDQIQQVAPFGAMTFRVSFGGVTVVKASNPVAQIRVRGVAMQQYQNLLSNGDTLTIAADSSQVSADGKNKFLFVSWSDGGARSHTITGSSAGSTYVATVSAQYLAQYAVAGSGSVSATRTIDPTNGSFLSAGDSVTLTPTPAAGQSFLGWSGDTTAGATALKLRMTHPFSVTANFAAPTDVVNELLIDSPTLTPAALQLLDQLGNKNGRFDIGDLVAWLDRNPGLATSPVVLKLLRGLHK